VPDWNTELRERERLFIDIVRLADKLGVQFAFPTQTVHLFKEEHRPKDQPHQPAHELPGASTDRRSMVTGVRAAQELIKQQPWLNTTPGPVVFRKGMTELNLDEAGNETLIEKPEKTEPTGGAADLNKPAGS
jgi:MscS family membrane protein